MCAVSMTNIYTYNTCTPDELKVVHTVGEIVGVVVGAGVGGQGLTFLEDMIVCA